MLTVHSPGRAAEQVAQAFHLAASGRPGPVVVGLPEDALVGPTDAPTRAPRVVAGGAVSDDQRNGLPDLLAAAHRPLVIVGGDRWTAASARAVTAWCERGALPVVTDWRSQDVADHAGPAYAG